MIVFIILLVERNMRASDKDCNEAWDIMNASCDTQGVVGIEASMQISDLSQRILIRSCSFIDIDSVLSLKSERVGDC
jgi:hypothetical protein